MQKIEKGSKGGAGAPFAIGIRERARAERWRGHVAAWIARLAADGGMMPAEWLEEIEERPLADVLTDALVRERMTGGGELTAAGRARVAYLRTCDESEEGRGTRARDNHEREIAMRLVFSAMEKSRVTPEERQRELVRTFYRAGDVGIHAAELRAVTCALNRWREAGQAVPEMV